MNLTDRLNDNFELSEFFVTTQEGGQAKLWDELQALPEAEREKILTNIKNLARRLNDIRAKLGPITITSGWRSSRVNKLVGGKPASQHLLGTAADIVVAGKTPKQVQQALDPFWFGGLGYGKTFTHLDIRNFKARFNY